MRKARTILSLSLVLLGILITIPNSTFQVHGQTGTVCTADFSTNPADCPASPASLNGPVGSSLVVAVNIEDAEALNGFDIFVQTNPAILQPVSTDLSGTVFPPGTNLFVLVNSVNGTTGLVRVAAVAIETLSTPPTTGRLFSITYNVVGSGGTSIAFPASCPGSSNDSFCVTITNPGVVPVNLQTALFQATPTQLSADFSVQSTVCPGVQVTFTASASAGTPPYLFQWDFGDGTTGSGNPVSHSYAVLGTFLVNLFVTDSVGSLVVVSHSVTVVAQPIFADFSFTPSSPLAGSGVTFTATVGGCFTPPVNFSWDFGDGTTGAGQSVSHVFPLVGEYTVSLAATDSNGVFATVSHALTVFPLGGPSLVCITDGGSVSCPSIPSNFNGPVGSQLTLAVNVQNTESFNGFDIFVQVDPAVLQPVTSDLTETVFPLETQLVLANTVNSSTGLARVAVAAIAFFTPAPTIGRLFRITYNIVGSGSTAISFPASCPGSSNDSFCVTITNPNLPGGLVPVNLQTATFGQVTPDFSIAASPAAQTVLQGSSAKSSIIAASLKGFTETVDLFTSAGCLALTCPSWTIDPTSVVLEPGGSATATLSFFTSLVTTPGQYVVTVTGVSGNLSHSVDVSFQVVEQPPPPPPGFSISASPSSQNVIQGESGAYTVILTSLNGFAGDVSLAAIVVPSGPQASLTPQVVTLASGGSGSSTLSVSTTASTPTGFYNVTVTGTGSSSHSITVSLNVIPPPLVGTVCIASAASTDCPSSPEAFTGLIGSQLVVAVNIEGSDALNGFDISVHADPNALYPVSADLTGTLLQNPFVLVNSADPATGLVRVAAVGKAFLSTPPTTGRLFSITYNIVGIGNSIPIDFTSIVVVNPNPIPENAQPATFSTTDFTVAASSLSLTLRLGETATDTITLTSFGDFSGQVNLSTSIVPNIRRGPRISLNPTTVTLTPDGTATSTLTINVPRNTIPETYTILLFASSGSATRSITITVTVLPRR